MINLFSALAKTVQAESEAEGNPQLPEESTTCFADCFSDCLASISNDTHPGLSSREQSEKLKVQAEVFRHKKSDSDLLEPGILPNVGLSIESQPVEILAPNQAEVKPDTLSEMQPSGLKSSVPEKLEFEPERFRETSSVNSNESSISKSETVETRMKTTQPEDTLRTSTSSYGEIPVPNPALESEGSLQTFEGANPALISLLNRYAPGQSRSSSDRLPEESTRFESENEISPLVFSSVESKKSEIRTPDHNPVLKVDDTRSVSTEHNLKARKNEDRMMSQSVDATVDSKSFEQVMESQMQQDLTPNAKSIVGQLVNGIVNEVMESAIGGDARREITIQIHPAELGYLKIKIESDDQGMTAEILASEAMTGELLNREREVLIEALREKGIELNSIHISHQQARERESDSRRNDPELPFTSNINRKTLLPKQIQPRVIESSSQINVIA